MSRTTLTQNEVEALQVGDTVGCVNLRGHGISGWTGKVVKTNGYGHVHVQPEGRDDARIFDKHGKERNKYRPDSLCDAQWLQERLAQQEQRRTKSRAARDFVNRTESIINGRVSYSGQFWGITAEERAELQAMLDGLAAREDS